MTFGRERAGAEGKGANNVHIMGEGNARDGAARASMQNLEEVIVIIKKAGAGEPAGMWGRVKHRVSARVFGIGGYVWKLLKLVNCEKSQVARTG